MRSTTFRPAVCLIGAGILLAISPPAVAETPVILAEEEVSVKRLEQIFRGAFMDVTIDDDGDLRIEDDGMKSFVRLETKKKLITFFSLWPMRASASELAKLQLVNEFNDTLIVVRFSMSKPTLMWCDYQLSYERGISAFSVVNSYRLFAKVVKGAVLELDKNDVIGKD